MSTLEGNIAPESIVDFNIIGAGASGLFVALLLIREGYSVRILEKSPHPIAHSRSIGIHPPSLEIFKKLGLFEQLYAEAVHITQGIAFIEGKQAGTLPLASGIGTDVVLSIPQHKTEAILENALPADVLLRSAKVTEITATDTHVEVHFVQNGVEKAARSRFVIGADGMHSTVRSLGNFGWDGHKYPADFCMGDFPDNTTFGEKAAIYLSKHGLTESFPLPDGIRRWVVNLPVGDREMNLLALTELIHERTGVSPDVTRNIMFSRFSLYRYQANTLVSGRTVLLGDAAHVMSPIGGQGMNVGWLNAWNLVDFITANRGRSNGVAIAFEKYNTSALRSFNKYADRADFNTKIGLPNRNMKFISLFIKVVLRWPMSKFIGLRFTMR
jgi:2-polyprenyl-6-methoxyphenol hydroxylase-like FAD-dependent oxidoreductase